MGYRDLSFTVLGFPGGTRADIDGVELEVRELERLPLDATRHLGNETVTAIRHDQTRDGWPMTIIETAGAIFAFYRFETTGGVARLCGPGVTELAPVLKHALCVNLRRAASRLRCASH